MTFEISTVMYEGEIVNCITRPIRCYEIREREEANSRTVTHTPETQNSKFDTTTKYWETTDHTAKIDWVSWIFFFCKFIFFKWFFSNINRYISIENMFFESHWLIKLFLGRRHWNCHNFSEWHCWNCSWNSWSDFNNSWRLVQQTSAFSKPCWPRKSLWTSRP